MRKLLLVFFLIFAMPIKVWSKDTLDVHILAVGNGHYAGNIEDEETGFNPTGAPFSASIALGRLESIFGSASRHLLTSSDNALITRNDIFDALDRLEAVARSTPRDDLIIVYYMGHGFGEGFGWNYFLQPGNVVIPQGEIGETDVVVLAETLIYAGDIVDRLKETGSRFLVIFDACYEGDEVEFASPVFSQEALRNIRDVAAIMRFMNEFHGNDPVIFSAIPGDTVPTVSSPVPGPASNFNIGPLARRLALAVDENPGVQPGSVAGLVRVLTQEGYLSDPESAPGVTRSEATTFYTDPSRRVTEIYRSKGSGSVDAAIRLSSSASASYGNYEAEEPSYVVRNGALFFIGADGEYISDGQSHAFSTETDVIEVEYFDGNSLELSIESDGWTYWASFAAPEGQALTQTRYRDAQRHGFQDAGSSGLSISGAGRGCNVIDGEFDVVAFNGRGGKRDIEITFSQVCDEEGPALSGKLKLLLEEVR